MEAGPGASRSAGLEEALLESLGVEVKDSAEVERRVIEDQRLRRSEAPPLQLPEPEAPHGRLKDAGGQAPHAGRQWFGLPPPRRCAAHMFGEDFVASVAHRRVFRRLLARTQSAIERMDAANPVNSGSDERLKLILQEELLFSLLADPGPEAAGSAAEPPASEAPATSATTPAEAVDPGPRKRRRTLTADLHVSPTGLTAAAAGPASGSPVLLEAGEVTAASTPEASWLVCPLCTRNIVRRTGNDAADEAAVSVHVDKCASRPAARMSRVPRQRSTQGLARETGAALVHGKRWRVTVSLGGGAAQPPTDTDPGAGARESSAGAAASGVRDDVFEHEDSEPEAHGSAEESDSGEDAVLLDRSPEHRRRRSRAAAAPTAMDTGEEAEGPRDWDANDAGRRQVRGELFQDDAEEGYYLARLTAWQEGHDGERSPGSGEGHSGHGDGVGTPLSLSLGDGQDPLQLHFAVARRLLGYQRVGVQWLWNLRGQGAGGILGDEMGLGKTVQVAAYLQARAQAGELSPQTDGPALILCPATMLAHWLRELHTWAPLVRVVVLHKTAVAYHNTSSPSRFIGRWVDSGDSGVSSSVAVVTTYESIRREPLRNRLLEATWGAAILDEGQRIRNHDAEISKLCKQLRTVHRLVVSGTPIQNALKELWSLFDFVFPGRLGTLPAFEDEFATPIRLGGYSNASRAQVLRAKRMAETLRLLMRPYLLRRYKKDVHVTSPSGGLDLGSSGLSALPPKTEQVLFCRLTPTQVRLYERVLRSPEMEAVLSGRARSFRMITVLRKLCNHADLVVDHPGRLTTQKGLQQELATVIQLHQQDGTRAEHPGAGREDGEDPEGPEEDLEDGEIPGGGSEAGIGGERWGHASRSGKLQVLAKVLPLWRSQGHRVLLFCQTRQMLSLVERWLALLHVEGDRSNDRPFTYVRLDGTTSLASRQGIVDRFNEDEGIFAALLTTRVGGIGVTLTGADRVVLIDPDWNPQTDVQARERAWRLGQTRPVTIYRLIVAGTIEEKVYHRQIFKTQISGNVLQTDSGVGEGFATANRLFSAQELKELFTLTLDDREDSLTSDIVPHGSVHRPQSTGDARRRRVRVRPNGAPEDTWESQVSRRRRRIQEAAAAAAAAGGGSRGAAGGGARGGAAEREDMDEAAVLRSLWDSSIKGAFSHDSLEAPLDERGRRLVNERRAQVEAFRLAGLVAGRFKRQLRNRTATLEGGFLSTEDQATDAPGQGQRAVYPSLEAEQALQAASTPPRRFGNRTHGLALPGAGSSSLLGEASLGGSPPFSTGAVAPLGTTAPLASQDLVARVREGRTGGSHAASGRQGGNGGSSVHSTERESKLRFCRDVLPQVVARLADKPNSPSQSLLDAFPDVPEDQAILFKEILLAVAACQNGKWKLKKDVREAIRCAATRQEGE